MKHIGFTGTRKGTTQTQLDALWTMMGAEHAVNTVAHHGDCKGADTEFHERAFARAWCIKVHPPSADTQRAFRGHYTAIAEPKPYMARNADIVRESDVMIACPAESTEQQRGGTWATIRMARRAGKPLAIVWPDGRVEWERREVAPNPVKPLPRVRVV